MDNLHLKLQIILEIYAILCLVGMPIVLVVAIYLYRKTDIIDRIDEWLDSVIGPPKTSVVPAFQERSETPTKETPAESSAEEIKEVPLPRFILHTGDSYQCWRPKDSYIANINTEWESDYPFIGEVERSQKVFIAKRTGLCPLNFDGKPKFEIEIRPRHTGWFSDEDIKDICNGVPVSALKTRMIECDLIQSDAGNLPLIYSMPFAQTTKATYAQKDGCLDRALYEIKESDDVLKALAERFDRIPTEGEVAAFYHLDNRNIVDAVVFLRTVNGKTLLGISSPWRTEMDGPEVKLNVSMIEKCFTDLTGETPAKVALQEETLKELSEHILHVEEVSTDCVTENPAEDDEETPPDTPEEIAAQDADENAHGQFEPIDIDEETPDEEEEGDGEKMEPGDDMPDMNAFTESEEQDGDDENADEGGFYDGVANEEIPNFEE